MTVELIQPPANGVLDLTTTKEQESTDVEEEAEVVPEGTDTSVPVTPEGDAVTTGESPTTEEEPELYFGDTQVSIEVPEEVATALSEAGVDQKQLLAELFAKDGKFELSAENREKLEAKYGKFMVDGYLKMYRTMNEQAVAKFSADAKTQQETVAAQHSEYNEVVGGAEGIEALEAFIVSKYDEKQIASYNAVMSGESFDAQMLVLRAVRAEMQATEKLAKGDKAPALLGDNAPASTASASADGIPAKLSAREYAVIMENPKYHKDKDYQRKVDASRLAGLRAGL